MKATRPAAGIVVIPAIAQVAWNSAGEWRGSRGWFNSVVPQPGRTFWFRVGCSI